MASVTIKSPKTIQDVAKTYTGNIANALHLTQSNNLKSQNLITGQKVIIPNEMLTPEYKNKLASLQSSSLLGSMNKMAKLMLGAAIFGGVIWYANETR